jgi:hypothetical protein
MGLKRRFGRRRPSTVRFAPHCRHRAALNRRLGPQDPTLALQQTELLFEDLVGNCQQIGRHDVPGVINLNTAKAVPSGPAQSILAIALTSWPTSDVAGAA